MKYFAYILLFSLTACTAGFEELNTNPNAPIDVQPELLLRQVIYDYGEQMSYEGFVAGNLLGQYFTMIDFNLFDRHSLTETQFGGNPWPILYTNLRDNETILHKALSNPTFSVFEGPARILKAYMTATLTDVYGDVPYAEALAGQSGNITPVYDRQQDIYVGENGILDNLRRGVAALEAYAGTTPLRGDILFAGDLDAWIRLGNALQIKYLMRISAATDVSTELKALFAADQFISRNDQNATYAFTNGQPNNFRLATARTGDVNLFIMSETIDEILTDLADPRIEVFFRPRTADGAFEGLRNGPDASQTSISVADYSLSGTVFREETGRLQANFMTAWETHFLLAEAAQKGLIDASAKDLYETGVRQAFAYWGATLPDDYLAAGAAAFNLNGADPIEQIITQKWIANIINGYEGWVEYRRTGFPALKPVLASLNEGLIPVRMPYPTDEQALNPSNFNTAADATNGNSVNAPVWWDR